MTWIQTRTGRQVYPLQMKSEDLDLVDIGWALSHVCRFSGHCERFLSVAEHSILVADLVQPQCQLCALLHDAAEAYLGDIARPIKSQMLATCGFGPPSPIKTVEREIQLLVARKWGCCAGFHCCREADEVMLATEGVALMGLAPEKVREQWPSLSADPLDRQVAIARFMPEAAFGAWMTRVVKAQEARKK